MLLTHALQGMVMLLAYSDDCRLAVNTSDEYAFELANPVDLKRTFWDFLSAINVDVVFIPEKTELPRAMFPR